MTHRHRGNGRYGPVQEGLAELASALRQTDMLWPRHDDEDFLALRALAWARCRGHLGDWPEWEALPEAERAALIDDFVATAGLPDDDITRSLADLFLDYGERVPHGPPAGLEPRRGDAVPRGLGAAQGSP